MASVKAHKSSVSAACTVNISTLCDACIHNSLQNQLLVIANLFKNYSSGNAEIRH